MYYLFSYNYNIIIPKDVLQNKFLNILTCVSVSHPLSSVQIFIIFVLVFGIASSKHKLIELEQHVTVLTEKLVESDQEKEQLKLEVRSANISLQDVQQRLHTLQVCSENHHLRKHSYAMSVLQWQNCHNCMFILVYHISFSIIFAIY